MAEAAVTILLENMLELETFHTDLISGAETEVKQLKKDFALLKAFLRDEANKPTEERGMESKIKEVVYQVEDAIEASLMEAAGQKSSLKRRVGLRNSKFEKTVNSIRQGMVKKLLEEVKEYSSTSKVSDATTSTQLQTRRTMGRPIKNDKVVGLEDQELIITDYLMEPKEKLDVISIIGMPGLGKTTLAREICKSEKIASEFQIRIWIDVSNFQTKDAYFNILKWFTSEDMSILTEEDLCETISACLDEEKFLLVVDNLCSSDDWKAIKKALPDSNGMGRVLITSREDHVGEDANTNRKLHNLLPLCKDKSWELLQLEVFGNLTDCHEELVELGKEIARKCNGVPQHILAVAGILKYQVTINGWKKVSENVHSLLKSKTSVSDVMELSYSMLPGELKDCFLYMGVFPEDCEISVWTLTRLWIAEGFIQPMEGMSLEEIASRNLDDLIGRSLVTADKTNFNGEVKTCRVHDMIRAFCITKSKEQNLFQEIKVSKETGALEPLDVQQSHRLCFHSDLRKFFSETRNSPQVRSFLCLYEQTMELEPQYMSVIPDSFHKLRILESKSIKFHQFPTKLTKLIHLRYLTLYIEALKVLPEPITQLWNLQTLVVETNSRSIIMKANMWRMIRLRYLKTRAAIVLDNTQEGEAGQNLHTLNRLAPESCTESVWKKAKNLKTLGIFGKLASIFETKFLEHLHHLEELKLVNSVIYEQPSEVMLHSLTPRNSFPPNLKRLTLTNTFVNWEHMSKLAMIKSLEALKLKNNAFVGVSWNVSGYGFPNLQLLLIVQTDLVQWKATPDSFPKLRFLVVKKCEDLKEIPESLGTHLEKLEIQHLRRSAVQSARTIEETAKAKVAVPFILKIGSV